MCKEENEVLWIHSQATMKLNVSLTNILIGCSWTRNALFFVHAKPCFHWRSFGTIMPATATLDSHYWTWLGHLGHRSDNFYFCLIDQHFRLQTLPMYISLFWYQHQGILKGEVSLYRWPPVWLVWISLFCKQKQNLSVVIQLIPNQSNRRSVVQWYFPL